MIKFYGDAMTESEREQALAKAPNDTTEIWFGFIKVGSHYKRVIRFFDKKDNKIGEVIFRTIK